MAAVGTLCLYEVSLSSDIQLTGGKNLILHQLYFFYTWCNNNYKNLNKEETFPLGLKSKLQYFEYK